ncbi:MAG: hypothetical protein NUV65_05395 [Candidatus Roizmanbacteria bacterium]|nr:hypothetical protein [Candidatus Roizmanbacteria bacterium]
MPKNKTIGAVLVFYNTQQKQMDSAIQQFNRIADANMLLCIDNSKNNVGYAKAVNKGIRSLQKYKLDVLIIANPDIDIHKITRATILETAQHFDIFGFPFREKKQTYYRGVIDNLNMSGGFTHKKENNTYVKTDFVSGSFMCIKSSVFEKIGYFNTQYFMYYEDVEFCLRAKKNEKSIGIRTDKLYTHISTSTPNKEYYLTRNRLLLLFRYGTIKQKLHEIIAFPKHCSIIINKQKLIALKDFIYMFLFN